MVSPDHTGTFKVCLQKMMFLVFSVLMITSLAQAQAIRTKEDLLQANKKLPKIVIPPDRADLLIEIGRYYLNLPGEAKQDLKTAMNYEKQALGLSVKIDYKRGVGRCMVLEGDVIREGGNNPSAEKKYNRAIAYTTKFQLRDELADAYASKGQIYTYEGTDLIKRIGYKEKARAIYHSTANKMKEADYLKDLADLYLLKGDGKYSIRLLDTALSIYKSIGFKELQGTYNIMCITYTELGDYSNALRCGLLAEKTAEAMNDNSLQKSSIYNHVALVYYYLRNDKEALRYWSSAKTVAEKYQDPGYMQTVMANIATVLIRMKRYEEGIAVLKEMMKKYPPKELQMRLRIPYILFNTYYDIKEYKKAEPYYLQLFKFHKDLAKDDINQSYLYRSIIRKLIHDKKYQEVQHYLVEHDAQSQEHGSILMRAQLHKQWFEVDSASGKPWSALTHFKLYKSFKDSLFNIEKSKQISGLEIEYQSVKKDKDILLLRQKSKLQLAMLQQETTVRYVFIGGLLLSVLFIALLYSRYRLKTRSHEVMGKKQEEINIQNELLKKLLGEKEWLLREIHHRVKNNLQIVISLLNTQSAYLDNEDALIAIRNSQNRMHAMSLIHQKLYQSDNLAEIDMNWYIRELVAYIRECFGTDKKILFSVDTEVIKLDVAQAVPLGLIINEAISNAIKYAFPGDRKGNVNISFKLVETRICELRIADDGIGLPEGFDASNTRSLGMSLMMGLSSQLMGEFKLDSTKGLTLEVTFERHHELLEYTEMMADKNEN